MRKKAYALSVLAAVFSLQVAATAQAASWMDVFQAVATQDPSAAKLAQYIAASRDMAGDEATVKAAVVQKVLEKAGVTGGAAGVPVVSVDDVRAAVRDAVRQQIQQQATAQLAPYEDRLTALRTLLSQTGLLPQAARDNNALPGAPANYRRVLNMTATAYAPGVHDNGRWGDLTYMGGKVHKGVAAVDPNVIPMGSRLWVEGYGYAIAADQGSAIKGNRIDLAFDDLQTALDYGIQNVKVYVLN